jgi:Domain of unknown function (DUF6916)
MQTRREFLRDCSLAAAAVLVPTAALAQYPASPTVHSDWPGFEQFRRQVNTAFVVRAGSQPVKLVLARATASSTTLVGSEVSVNESFSLLFQGPAQPPLKQETYLIEHPRLGCFPMFIVPVGRAHAAYCRYEAVFSRPSSAAELALQLSRAPKRFQKC